MTQTTARSIKRNEQKNTKNIFAMPDKDKIGSLYEKGITLTVTETQACIARRYGVTVYSIGGSGYYYLHMLMGLHLMDERTPEMEDAYQNLLFGLQASVLPDGYWSNPELLGESIVWHLEKYEELFNKIVANKTSNPEADAEALAELSNDEDIKEIISKQVKTKK